MIFAADWRRREYQSCIRSHAAALQLISFIFHAEVQTMRDPSMWIEGVSLSHRQMQCLEWAARGKSVAKVSELLGISRPTARYHLDRAKAKFGVKTNAGGYRLQKETRRLEDIPSGKCGPPRSLQQY